MSNDLEFRVKYLERVVEDYRRELDNIKRHLRSPIPRPFFGENEDSGDNVERYND